MNAPLDALVRRGFWDLVAGSKPLTATAQIEQRKALERHGQEVQARVSADDRAMVAFMDEHYGERRTDSGWLVGSSGERLRRRPTNAQIAAACAFADPGALDAEPEPFDPTRGSARHGHDGVCWA